MSLKNYEPALFELIERAFQSKAEVRIPLGSLRAAQNLTLRFQRLRREMRLENHHLVTAADTLEFVADKKTFEAIIRPQGYTYIGQVQAALARLNEISPEVQEHELENTPLDGYAGRLGSRQDQESEGAQASSVKPNHVRSSDPTEESSPQEEALKAFMKKGD